MKIKKRFFIKTVSLLLFVLIIAVSFSSCGKNGKKGKKDKKENNMNRNLSLQIIEKNSPVSREQGDFPILSYYGWPSVAVDENDITYAVCSKRLLHIDPYGKVMLYKSLDKGKTWDEGTVIIDTVLDDRDAGILYLGNGKMLVTTFSHDSNRYVVSNEKKWVNWQDIVGEEEKQRVFSVWDNAEASELKGSSSYIISEDYGKTWSKAQYMPITAPHGPTLMKNGDLLYVGNPKAPELCGEALQSGLYCYISKDGGKTWQQQSKLPVSLLKKPVEPHAIELQNGDIIAAIRSNESYRTSVCRSTDGGKTWSEDVDVTYGFPPHLFETEDGVVILSYSTRSKDKKGEHIRLSYDNGETWSEEMNLSTVPSPEKYTGADIGYPATARYSDGTFITVYYQKIYGDRTPSLCRTLWELK